MAIGWLLSCPDPQERIAVPLLTSMRHPDLTLLFDQLPAPTMAADPLLPIPLSIPIVRWRPQVAAACRAEAVAAGPGQVPQTGGQPWS